MSLSVWNALVAVISFPRVSGDEPVCDSDADLAEQFSPRERG